MFAKPPCVVSGCGRQSSRTVKMIPVCRDHSRQIQVHAAKNEANDRIAKVTGIRLVESK